MEEQLIAWLLDPADPSVRYRTLTAADWQARLGPRQPGPARPGPARPRCGAGLGAAWRRPRRHGENSVDWDLDPGKSTGGRPGPAPQAVRY